MGWLGTAASVQSKADNGTDFVNVETGEFYSFSRYKLASNRIAGLYGTIDIDALQNLKNSVDASVGTEEFMGLVEDACRMSGGRLVPRYMRDGHVMSIKEASRVSHASGWVSGHPAQVYDDVSLGRPMGVDGPFVKKVRQLQTISDTWSSVPFDVKRGSFANELSTWGFDKNMGGTPATEAQQGFIYDMAVFDIDCMPESLATLSAAGVLTRYEAASVIEAAHMAQRTHEPFDLSKVHGLDMDATVLESSKMVEQDVAQQETDTSQYVVDDIEDAHKQDSGYELEVF